MPLHLERCTDFVSSAVPQEKTFYRLLWGGLFCFPGLHVFFFFLFSFRSRSVFIFFSGLFPHAAKFKPPTPARFALGPNPNAAHYTVLQPSLLVKSFTLIDSPSPVNRFPVGAGSREGRGRAGFLGL